MSDNLHLDHSTPHVLLSIVVPAYNEDEALTVFQEHLSAVLNSMFIDSEIVFVNNGSHNNFRACHPSTERTYIHL